MFENLFAFLTERYSEFYHYLDAAVNHNEFASGLLMTGISGVIISSCYFAYHIFVNGIKKHFTTTMTIESDENLFRNIHSILMVENIVNSARTIMGIDLRHDRFGKVVGLGYHFIFFNGVPMLLSLKKNENQTMYSVKYTLTMSKLGRSHKAFDDLISKANSVKRDPHSTSIYQQQGSDDTFICTQDNRTFDSIVLDANIKQKLISSLDDFLKKKEWYKKHGIPYQLGILLYGEPGTGKTSLIRAIASYLGKDIVFAQDGTSLENALKMPNGRIVVAEEIDTFTLGSRKLDDNNDSKVEKPIGRKDDKNELNSMMQSLGQLNLSKILTAVDGIIQHDGRILILTTNKKSSLDPALLRPGRIDLDLYIGFMTNEMFKEYLEMFFDNIDLKNRTIKHGVTSAMIQNDIIMNMPLDEIIKKHTDPVG